MSILNNVTVIVELIYARGNVLHTYSPLKSPFQKKQSPNQRRSDKSPDERTRSYRMSLTSEDKPIR